MDKPVSILVNETKTKLIQLCNSSNLPPCVLELIIESIYKEIHSLSQNQLHEDELVYLNSIKEDAKKEQ